MNKTKIAFLLIVLAAVGYWGFSKRDDQKIEDTKTISILEIEKKAKKNIQEATRKEQEKINNSLEETETMNNSNLEYVEKYSGAVIKTNLGNIEVKFHNDNAPITVNNFLKLADEDFYDGIKFHRVIKGFMIQGGDPNSKEEDTSMWGVGDPGYKFDDELTGKERYPQGTLAMANSGPNTNGSQFFIVTASPEASLPPSYTVFGEVISGLDVALKIENVQTTTSDRPIENVVIEAVEIK